MTETDVVFLIGVVGVALGVVFVNLGQRLDARFPSVLAPARSRGYGLLIAGAAVFVQAGLQWRG